jgi:hypothetical protein
MRPIGRPQYKSKIVQDAAERVIAGTISIDELQQIAAGLGTEDAALIGGLIESIIVLDGLGNP